MQAVERKRGEVFAAFLDSPELVELHRRMLPPPRRRSRRDLDVHLVVGLAKLDECANLEEALEVLTEAEKRALLGSGFLERVVPFAECADISLAEEAVAASR